MSRPTRQIVLLRAVNVGGRKLAMADLRAALTAAGCGQVDTYIQSGNVVLDPPDPVPTDLAAWLEEQIAGVAGFPVPVVLRTAEELDATVAANPFPEAGGTRLHVVFFARRPPAGTYDEVAATAPERFALVDRDLYLDLPSGAGQTKLPAALERAGRRAGEAPGTARNWNTVLKLQAMAHAD